MPAQAPIDIYIRPLMLKVGWCLCTRKIGDQEEYNGELLVAEMNGVECQTTVAGPCFLRARLPELGHPAIHGSVDHYSLGYVTEQAQYAATRPPGHADHFGYTFLLPGKCTLPHCTTGLQLSLTFKQ